MRVHGMRLFGWIFLAAVVGIGSGCNQQNSRVGEPEFEAARTLDQSHPRAKLVLGSDSLVGDVRLSAPRFRSVGVLTEAQVSVQNLTGTQYTLEYRFDWEDEQGFATGNRGSWQRFYLGPKEIARFNSVGKVPEARNIVFTVRLPDDYFIRNPDERKPQQSNEYNPE